MKFIARSAAAAAGAETYQPEVLADEDPRYLRRQKAVEIRRKKFGVRSWPFYRRILMVGAASLAGASAAVFAGRFLLYSPQMLLTRPEQIDVIGNHMIGREAVVEKFYADRGRSVLRVPLEARRAALEALPWVEQTSVQRILPNRLRVEITERTPIAFLRMGTDLALIDTHGVILDRPADQEFQFPIVSGVLENLSREERERRMATFQEFMKDADLVRPGASEQVSEVDLANPRDLRVVMTGLAGGAGAQAVTIHFGQGDFIGKYRMLADNFAQWQANVGKVHSIDLQYTRQVVVNPEPSPVAPPDPNSTAPAPVHRARGGPKRSR